LYFLYIVLCSIFYKFRSLYSLCLSSRSHWYTCSHQTPLPHDVLASCMLVGVNFWYVYVESLLNIIMYFVVYLVVGFHSHLHLSSFNINTNIHMKGEYKADPSLYKMGKAFIFCKMNVLNKKLLFFWLLSQYTWSGILNKDNTCTTIHFHEGDTPLRTACRPISVLCTAYRHVLASRTAYRLTTRQLFFGNFIYIKKIKWTFVAHVQSFLQTLNLVCLLVRFSSALYPQINVYVNKC